MKKKKEESAMADQPKIPRVSDFVRAVAGEGGEPPDVRVLTGWLGDTGDAATIRLYLDAELSTYGEMPREAIRYIEELPDSRPAGAVRIWVRRDAELKEGGSALARAAKFLFGQVQQDFAGRAAGGGAAGAAGAAQAQPQTQFCLTLAPGCEVTGFTGQCESQLATKCPPPTCDANCCVSQYQPCIPQTEMHNCFGLEQAPQQGGFEQQQFGGPMTRFWCPRPTVFNCPTRICPVSRFGCPTWGRCPSAVDACPSSLGCTFACDPFDPNIAQQFPQQLPQQFPQQFQQPQQGGFEQQQQFGAPWTQFWCPRPTVFTCPTQICPISRFGCPTWGNCPSAVDACPSSLGCTFACDWQQFDPGIAPQQPQQQQFGAPEDAPRRIRSLVPDWGCPAPAPSRFGCPTVHTCFCPAPPMPPQSAWCPVTRRPLCHKF